MNKYFVLLLLTMGYPAKSQELTVEFNATTLEDVFQILERETEYRFYYSLNWIDSAVATGSFENSSVEEIVSSVLQGTDLHYYVRGPKVILTKGIGIRQGLHTGFYRAPEEGPEEPDDFAYLNEIVKVLEQQESSQQIITIGKASETILGGSSTIAGYVREAQSGEPVPGALVFTREPFVGVSTDQFGFYSLTIPNGPITVFAQYVGLKSVENRIQLYSDGPVDFNMVEDVIALKEVTIESERDANVNGTQMGVNVIDSKSLKNLPLILGEPDLLKVAVTLPGVQSIGEGAWGLNVRGGSVDQNLMTVNEAPIYNPSHFFGFFSTLNPNVIKKLDLYKSSIPAQHGSRLSSIFDIQTKDGNLKKITGSGNVSPVTAGLTLEGPIVQDKTSFIVGARTTYSDWVLGLLPESQFKNSEASFYDIIGKVNHSIDDRNYLSVTGYFSKDNFRLGTDSLFSYTNANGSFQWRHNFNNKLISVISGVHSQYQYKIDFVGKPNERFNSGFKINESNLKVDLNYYLNKTHKLDMGYQGKFYQLNPGYVDPASPESLVSSERIQKEQGLENAVYLADNFEVNRQLSLYLGLRYSSFTALGPRAVYTYAPGITRSLTSITDTTEYASGEAMKTYHGPEFRFSVKYSLRPDMSMKVGFNRTRQYIHLVSNTIAVAPTDTWKLSDKHIKPQIGDQLSLGVYKNFFSNTLETSAEAYYKDLQNLVDFKNGADLTLNQNIETDLIQGDGRAYGVEFLIKKKAGKLNGWVSYTYSRTKIKLDSELGQDVVNGGNYFPANFDKPHDFTLISNYKLTRRYSFSANATYSTGRPITFPVAKYRFAGGEKIHFSQRNEFRVPNYFRVDLSFNLEGNHKIKKLAHSYWSFSIYNITGRNNVYSIFFTTEEGMIKANKLSVFGSPIPTISYNFSF